MARKKGSAAPANETTEQKLIRLANTRVNRAVKSIGGIGNLASLKPNTKQIEQIENALSNALRGTLARLKGTGGGSFDLGGQ